MIALILPDIENPFFTSLARGVEDVAQQHGYSVVMCNSDDDIDKESQYLRIAMSDRMAGIIICPADETTSLESVLGSIGSVVVVDRTVREDVDQVVLDNDAVSRRAVTALIKAGRTRIACVTGPAKTLTARTRAEVWRRELTAAGLHASDDLLAYGNFRVDGGRTATERLLSLPEPPDGILTWAPRTRLRLSPMPGGCCGRHAVHRPSTAASRPVDPRRRLSGDRP
ncbi:substrate-binding domain-containing protein [Georgenia sp. SUBG003]|uniref:substrate-binding domain-containing protein n=1 Tax=Georgenia sp. SUBG003 TaxID=1497974 RepID=UPI003AB36F3C